MVIFNNYLSLPEDKFVALPVMATVQSTNSDPLHRLGPGRVGSDLARRGQGHLRYRNGR